MRKAFFITLAGLALAGISAPAQAQLNNKPFSFKNSPAGGVGMSIGGRQAIIAEKITGSTPHNLVRGSGGQLLDVVEGPGNAAIVSHQGGGVIPSFRGTGWRGDSDMAVGVFNAYFSPSNGSSGISDYAHLHSGSVVSTWTARVASGGVPVSFSNNSVDIWTGLVQTMN